MEYLVAAVLLAGTANAEPPWKRKREAPLSEIDQYLEEARARSNGIARQGASPGSTYVGGGRLADLARDPRAYQLDDIVTIVVSDRASAIARGVTSTSRNRSANNSITSLAGVLPAAGPLANLTNFGGQSKLDGQGQTSRETELSTTLSARVAEVLPNGNLVLVGMKRIGVNSESQTVMVKGICRPQDLGQANQVASDRLAFLEVQVNGKGVVGDAIRRPFILYRILEGLLPF